MHRKSGGGFFVLTVKTATSQNAFIYTKKNQFKFNSGTSSADS